MRSLVFFPFLTLVLVSVALAQEKHPQQAPGDSTKRARVQCEHGLVGISVLRSPQVNKSVATLRCTEEFVVLEEKGEFYRIRTKKGQEGYVSHAFLVVGDENHGKAESSAPDNTPDDKKLRLSGQNRVPRPECVDCPSSGYPATTKPKKTEVVVLLQVVVSPEGRPTEIVLVSGPGHGLEEKAVDAVQTWKLEPTTGPGRKPVPVLIEVKFHLP